MGMAVGGGKKRLSSDINVVPLVDITLVLLIIFMVMTPMMQRGYDMSIPEKAEVQQASPPPSSDQMVVKMTIDGQILLNTKPTEIGALQTLIEDRLRGRRQKIVFFEADDDLFYEDVIKVMDVIRAAGGTIGLVTTNI